MKPCQGLGTSSILVICSSFTSSLQLNNLRVLHNGSAGPSQGPSGVSITLIRSLETHGEPIVFATRNDLEDIKNLAEQLQYPERVKAGFALRQNAKPYDVDYLVVSIGDRT